ncbi:uncharacterized protein CLAFUR5_07387 [Fulvia fulva]|uniref:Uncharacterized protein n=1 Tax=Passalora fulva TaxID=5499 RepID=A0A9Q8PBB4_PASFU|nr:uncharacterized protein CLAFUR5_07387 [Fulvia fulva]KAK4623310.1 hypothetical protein CLAFUR0_07262 [Fulvia fulva]UJO19326.1 hypothetical protein CLAFUR5_07387 [Fulvia fulva]WPV31252.1 hypothetical protein CLAFUW7_07258 [Fulvia fulva]
MSSSSDIEHWPDDDALYAQPAAPAPGYDGNNGLNHHSYLPPVSEAPKSDISAPRDAPPAPSQIVYPQPIYYAQHPAHMMPQQPQPQYYSHGQAVYAMPPGQPQPVYYAAPPAGPRPAPQYYTYATAPVPTPAPAPAPASAKPAKSANFHVYQPMSEKSEKAAVSDGNMWLGRTKQQVEEDNMKIAKKAGAYDKRKIAPIVEDDNTLFWVNELDKTQTVRDYRYIKTVPGHWENHPQFPGAYYFVVEKDEPEGK